MAEADTPNDTILPEIDTDSFYDDASATKKRSKRPLFIVCTIFAFIALTASLVIVIVNSNQRIAELTSPTSEKGGYYNAEDFKSTIVFARNRLAGKDYDSALHALKKYNLTERMTTLQKYRYYALMTDIYSPTGMDNPELYTRYLKLAENNLTKIREGED